MLKARLTRSSSSYTCVFSKTMGQACDSAIFDKTFRKLLTQRQLQANFSTRTNGITCIWHERPNKSEVEGRKRREELALSLRNQCQTQSEILKFSVPPHLR